MTINVLKNYKDWVLVNCSSINNADIFPIIEQEGQPALILIAAGEKEIFQPPLQLLFRMLGNNNNIVIYGGHQLNLYPETEYCLLTWGESFPAMGDLIDFWG
jgi:hypothetical protein